MHPDRSRLYGVVAHSIGDFLLQPTWMGQRKLDSIAVRAVHVIVYTTVFVPLVATRGWTLRQARAFLGTLGLTHFVIDSRRWHASAPIWVDQGLHMIALALAFAIAERHTEP